MKQNKKLTTFFCFLIVFISGTLTISFQTVNPLPNPLNATGNEIIKSTEVISPVLSVSKDTVTNWDLDSEWYSKVAGLLTRSNFTYPAEARALWIKSDELPEPDDKQFAQKVKEFLPGHPTPSPEEINAIWEVPAMASRQCKCLAYLSGGGLEARDEVSGLCALQAIRLQRMFPPFRRGASSDTTFYGATASMSLTGYLLLNQSEKYSIFYEVGKLLVQTGLGQFETSGGEGNAILKEAAKTLIFDKISDSSIRDLHGTDEEFFMQLDLSRPDMREVAGYLTNGNLGQAKQAYINMLAKRFTNIRSVTHNEKELDSRSVIDDNADSNEKMEIANADGICRSIFTVTSHMYKKIDFGKEIDWFKVFDNDIESRVWANHHPWMLKLIKAYYKTGNEKYITNLCRLFNSWYKSSPVTFERSVAQWRTLAAGTRAGHRWYYVLCALADHPVFKRECLFNMARSVLDHGKYLSMYAQTGGNWLQVETTGLASVALMFPEFKLSPLFYKVGLDRLTAVNAVCFFPDGFQTECTPFYHQYAIDGFSPLLRLANSSKVPFPNDLAKVYDNATEALMYIPYSNLTLPMLSDLCPYHTTILLNLIRAEALSHRKDLLWLISNGKQGTQPAGTSHDFTQAGYAVMRDKWGPDGQVLIFDAGYFGSGHQHDDKLNFVYYAGGRELIGDPGIYLYVIDEFEPYWRGSWGHNTITIDGMSQDRKLGPKEDIPDPDRRFVMGDGFDFASGWYKHAYSPRRSRLWEGQPRDDKADESAAIRDIQHQRCIFYVKGEYAIICDRVLGEGEHQIDINFHPAPIVNTKDTSYIIRPVNLEIGPHGTLITKENDYSNVAILPAQGNNFKVLDMIGQKNPVRGWYSLYGIQPSHDIVYRCRKTLPAHFETVVQSLPAGSQVLPNEVKSLEVEHEGAKEVAGIKYGEDLFLLSYDGPTKMKYRNIIFEGSALMVRYDSKEVIIQAQMVDGQYLSISGKTVFSTNASEPAHILDLQ